MPEIVVAVQNASKAYRIWERPAARLTVPVMEGVARLLPSPIALALRTKAAKRYRDFWALRDISFEVQKGKAMGIIGRNGSGKSTLLQIIAGTLQTTNGLVMVNGRVAALLELGSGFNPEFTGRENVYLNAAVLGLSRSQTDARFDQIAAFADIGDFLDQPVKMYSSGMLIRLAFACAVSVEPDVLIVDEALSVGDVFFQQKCFDRIRQILDQGTTLIFASHDLAAVQNLCHAAILLERGASVYMGKPEECVSRYYARHQARTAATSSVSDLREPRRLTGKETALLARDNVLGEACSRHGDRSLELLAARWLGENGEPTRYVGMSQPLRLEVWFRANRDVGAPACGLHLFDRMNNLVFGAGTPQLRTPIPAMVAGDEALLAFTMSFSVQPGPYTFNISLGEPDPENPNVGSFFDVCEGLGPIHVSHPDGQVWPFYGIANLPMTVTVAKV